MKFIIFLIMWFLVSFVYLIVYASSDIEKENDYLTKFIIILICLPATMFVLIWCYVSKYISKE